MTISIDVQRRASIPTVDVELGPDPSTQHAFTRWVAMVRDALRASRQYDSARTSSARQAVLERFAANVR